MQLSDSCQRLRQNDEDGGQEKDGSEWFKTEYLVLKNPCPGEEEMVEYE